MEIINKIILLITGFSSGIIISGGIFAFIAAIGVVPRLAQRTKTIKYIRVYEEAIIFGGISGCITMLFDFRVNIMPLFIALYSFCIGVFIGSVAVSLAEVLDVMPIFMRRIRIKRGLIIFITALAVGKTVGSLIYFLQPYFYN